MNIRTTSVLLSFLTGSLPSVASAEVENQIPLGVEAVSTYRSEYVNRGFKMSGPTLDFQLGGEVRLRDEVSLGYSAWYASETSSGDFSETGLKISSTTDLATAFWTNSVGYINRNNSEFDSGIELTTKYSYLFPQSEDSRISNTLSGILSYDSAAEGWYTAVEFSNYTPLGKDSYLSFKAGLSATSDYYSRHGLNDVYTRLSYTYNLTKQVSLTPYLGSSIQLDKSNGSDLIYGGIWFAVSF